MASWPLSAYSQSETIIPQQVSVVGSGNRALDSYFVGLIADRAGPNIELKLVADSQLATVGNEPVVTIGPKAFDRLRREKPNVAVLGTLIERQFLDKYPHEVSDKISAVLYDVPLIRQALTGKAILPHVTKVAILVSPHNRSLYDPLLERLPDFGLKGQVFIVTKQEQLIPTLIRALNYGDLLLGTPDGDIYHPRNIKHILLTAYRRSKILIGPSQAYVKAGSLASSYPTYSSMADRTAEYLIYYSANGRFPPASYPEDYNVDVNRQVARSLNIPLSEPEQLSNIVDKLLLKSSQEVSDD
ncbi:ABC transporter substrate-binding protein [Marinobacter sp. SBS5]|uniref:ABC transporter substrate-binding protein n=1 Tax=Marinobacter sp. SBS5 TaxID=3401754 RepID=UPI003AADB52D